MMKRNKILILCKYFIFFILEIECTDIKMTLGKKLNEKDNAYPLFITLNEKLIDKQNFNSFDLFCFYQIRKKDDEKYLNLLYNTLNTLIEKLNPNEGLSLISMMNYDSLDDPYEMELKKMTESNEEKFLEVLNNIKQINKNSIKKFNLDKRIKQFINEEYNYFNPNHANSVIFIFSGKNDFKLFFKENFNDEKFKNFSFHFFVINQKIEESRSNSMINFSKERGGGYYEITSNDEVSIATLNVIGGLRTIKYKYIDIQINNKTEIQQFYGSNFLSSYYSLKNTTSFTIYQFISGIEYTYVLLININENIKMGDIILTINANCTNYNKENNSLFEFIKFYNVANYFFSKKSDFCRVKTMEEVEKLEKIQNAIRNNIIKEKIEEIKKNCGEDINEEILKILNNTDFSSSHNINKTLSEGYISRGGINLWNSNDYQKKLVKE